MKCFFPGASGAGVTLQKVGVRPVLIYFAAHDLLEILVQRPVVRYQDINLGRERQRDDMPVVRPDSSLQPAFDSLLHAFCPPI